MKKAEYTASLLEKDPDHFRKMGQKGGKAKTAKGFAKLSREEHLRLSQLGGRNGGKEAKSQRASQES